MVENTGDGQGLVGRSLAVTNGSGRARGTPVVRAVRNPKEGCFLIMMGRLSGRLR